MKKIIMLGCIVFLNKAYSIKEIPLPDLSQSNPHVVEVHDKMLASFNSIKEKVTGIKLGSVYGELCMFYQAHEFIMSAKICYLNAIEMSKFDYRWHYLLGFIDASEGDFNDAISRYEKVMNINPDYLPAKIRHAEIELEKGEFENSKRLFLKVLDRAPDFSRALVGLGTIEMQNGNFKGAINYFSRVKKLQPLATQVNYLISQAFSALGNEKEAQKYLGQKGKRSVAMYDKVLQAMRLHSESASYYAQAAINAFLNADYDLAEKLVTHSIKLDSSNLDPKFTLMNVYVSTNRTNEAIKLAKSLLSKHPEDDRLPYSIGLNFELVGDDENAIKWYRNTLEVNKEHITSHLSIGKALMRLKKYNKALKIFREAQELNTDNAYALFAEASILSYLMDCDKSIAKYLDAIKASSKENFLYLTAFVKTVAVCNIRNDQIKSDALNAARNMYLYNPTIRVVQSLAMIEMANGNNKNAIDYQAQVMFQSLVQKLPNNIVQILKSDYELFKKGETAKKAIYDFDLEINPVRAKRK